MRSSGELLWRPSKEDGFNVIRHPSRPWTLYTPRKDKYRWEHWELPFRSLVLDDEDRIISSGFPKFFNAGEHLGHTRLLEEAIGAGDDVVWTEKIDGSLAIRFVHDGQVYWRTRGTHDGGDMLPAILEAASQYPSLNDPIQCAQVSLLFEFQHPDYRIILPVDTPKLTLVGAIDDIGLWRHETLQSIADIYGFPVVETFDNLTGSLEDVSNNVGAWTTSEGVVARCCGEQIYVKLKADDYLRLHSLKFSMTRRKLWETFNDAGTSTYEQFEEYMVSLGLDWETIQMFQHDWFAYEKMLGHAHQQMGYLNNFYQEYGELAKVDRKRYASLVQIVFPQSPILKSAAFQYADKGQAVAWDFVLEKIMEAELRKHNVPVEE